MRDPLTIMWLAVGLATVAVWGMVLGPSLANSAKSRTALLPSVILWVALLGPVIVIAIDPIDHSAIDRQLSPLGLAVSRSVTVALSLLVFIGLIGALRANPRPRRAWLVALLAFLAVNVASSAYYGAFDTAMLLTPAVIYFVARTLPSQVLISNLRMILRVIVGASLAALVFTFENATAPGRQLVGFDQVAGLTSHPNSLGTIAAVALGLELFRSQISRVWVTASTVALILSYSRGGWLVAAVIVLVWSHGRFGKVVTATLAVVGVTLGWVLFSEGTGLTGRDSAWALAWEIFLDHPIFGAGVEAQSEAARGGMEWAGQAHNQVIDALAKTGIVGAGLVIAFAVAGYRAVKHLESRLPFAVFCGIAALALVESPLRGLTLTLPLVVIIAATSDRGWPAFADDDLDRTHLGDPRHLP